MTIDIGPNIVSVVIAIIGMITSIVGAYFAYKAHTSASIASTSATAANASALATGIKVDGRLSELLTISKAASRAEGVVAGLSGDTTVPPVVPDPTFITNGDTKA
jgi:hypothetical protein